MTNEPNSNVNIKLISTIRPIEGDSEIYEMWLEGSYIEKANSTYLRYEEIQNEQVIRTTLKLGNDQALIMRGGGVNMRLPLNIIEQQVGHYESEFGSMPLMTRTNALNFNRKPDMKSGEFSVQYDLIIGGQSVGNYKLDIQFTEVLA